MATRNASIVAVALEVHCPHCGDPQPAPGGSEMWEPHEVTTAEGVRQCVSCDKQFRIVSQSRVNVPAWGR